MENNEREAYLFGGKCGAEYAKSINKSNMAEFTGDEWLTFCECMCKNYHLDFIRLNKTLDEL